ncbi:hypothetical protein TAMA11512_04190 [Selenomonas sp. TAMA-11512]|uniref:Cap15 family cyclic dinucleotide receptor domain-containing protein n=1 Tax=Selenomonas sp. TAMA-11512 TaxID=3095337 RepID=UPI003092CDA2|nr:hypothetical protein TAMA11512_04190 [Selenomonas sp. TAMA-11512]
MDSKITKLLSKSLWIALALFAIRYLIWNFNSLYDFIGAAGEVISITIIIMSLYSGFLWRYNPFEKTPKLMGLYEGIIEYNYNGAVAKKDTFVRIRQTLLSIKIQITTNEITSNTIVANLVEENEEYVLYYTYITNPKSKYSKGNPIQHGTCRLILSAKDYLSGKYWTSRQTIGDIELKRIDDSK